VIRSLLGDSISGATAAWGLEVQRFEMKDVELPKAMQHGLAGRSHPRKARASSRPKRNWRRRSSLELRRMQMISEVGAENNSTTALMIRSDFVSLAHGLDDYLAQHRPSKSEEGA
jgi:hypothetical protein